MVIEGLADLGPSIMELSRTRKKGQSDPYQL